MCTVTVITSRGCLLITANRDEQTRRKPALPPAAHALRTGRILFPEDGEAGGTWIAAHENGNAAVLLNGAFTAHTPAPPYRKSRGLVVLDCIDQSSPFTALERSALEDIEPFTLVLRDGGLLFECRWDGKTRHSKQLDSDRPMIWSSATLYSPATANRREQWFQQWLSRHPDPSQEAIIDFHRFTGEGDAENDLMMNRGGLLRTVSITSLSIDDRMATMTYLDLIGERTFFTRLQPDGTPAAL